MSIVNSFKAYAQITRMAANAEERTSQLEPLSGLVVRVSMKPVSTMQIGSGQNGHCGKGSAIDFVADAKVEAYDPLPSLQTFSCETAAILSSLHSYQSFPYRVYAG